jgi:diguanylate cyclase (GGDEF)-like protein
MEPFAKAFDQLRREYLAEGATRLTEIRADADRYRAGEPAALGALRTRFHRLVGSGGSYGFPEISSAAREAERWLSRNPPPAPLETDWLDDAVDRLAVLFTEAEHLLRAAVGESGTRLAVVAGPDGELAEDLREILSSAGFTVRFLPIDARPDDVARPETAQIVVLIGRGSGSYAAAAAWSSAAAPVPRTVVLIEEAIPVDRLRAAVAGVELVLPVERAATELARLAQRHVLTSAPRFVAVLADDDETRGSALAEGLLSQGMEVRRAATTDAARQHLDLSVPDLVVASASLPEGGGRALARLVRQDPRCVSVPVVLMGAVSEEDRLAALREGVDEVMTGARTTSATAQELRARAERGRRVRELIRRDPLTGALDDPAFRAELDQAVFLARRDGRPLTLLLVVVEELDEVNARHGHAIGDRLLAHVAAVLRATVRQSDIVGRRGGRTFAVILRGSAPEGAGVIATKLRSMLADHPYETRDGGTLPVRVTLKSASLGDDVMTAEELEERLRA